jgi:hypothetical protein
MSDEHDEDRPYTEAQWEALFRESDVKAAKFGELLETLHDEPDHELIIAREMGWTWLVKALEEKAANEGATSPDAADEAINSAAEPASCEEGRNIDDDAGGDDAFGEDLSDDDEHELDDSWLDDSADDLDDDFDDDFDDEFDGDGSDVDPWDRRNKILSQIPAYAAARKLGSRISDVLRPLMEGEDPDDDRSRLLAEAYISVHQAAAKISGGHAMGYDDDVLCGNIVNNRIALEAVGSGEQAWRELVEQHIISREVAEPFIAEMRDLQNLLEERIADLRSRVWW